MSEELDVDGLGEDEIEFADYRKELRGILNTVGNMVGGQWFFVWFWRMTS